MTWRMMTFSEDKTATLKVHAKQRIGGLNPLKLKFLLAIQSVRDSVR